MVHVETSCGFTAEVDEKNIDDMRFLEALADLEGGKVFAMAKLAALLLGEKDKKRLYDMLKDEKGRVPSGAASDQITEIMAQIKQVKN